MTGTFAPHSRAGQQELISPSDAVLFLLERRFGKESDSEPLVVGSPLYKEIGQEATRLQEGLHTLCRAGELTALVQSGEGEALYKVPRQHWKECDQLEGGFGDNLFCFSLSEVPARFHDAPVFFLRSEVERLALDQTASDAPPQSRAGRKKGQVNYPEDAMIVDRIIALCDKEKLPLATAINRMLPDIAPRNLDDDSKKRRIRPKVLQKRPDLRN